MNLQVIDSMDKAAAVLDQHPNALQIEPLHRFTNGMYIREIAVPAGYTFVTEIHKTEHPLTIVEGCLSIWTGEEIPQLVETGDIIITTPGTRRFIYAHTNAVLRTFHPNPDNEKDLQKLHDMIIEQHTNPYLIPFLEGENT